MGNGGFEPPTSALSAHCSTTEIISQAEDVGFEPTDPFTEIKNLAGSRFKPLSQSSKVGRAGFEPAKAEPSDLQSDSFNHSETYPCEPLYCISP